MNDLTLTERLTAWRAALENQTDTPEALEIMWQGLLREVERLEGFESNKQSPVERKLAPSDETWVENGSLDDPEEWL